MNIKPCALALVGHMIDSFPSNAFFELQLPVIVVWTLSTIVNEC